MPSGTVKRYSFVSTSQLEDPYLEPITLLKNDVVEADWKILDSFFTAAAQIRSLELLPMSKIDS